MSEGFETTPPAGNGGGWPDRIDGPAFARLFAAHAAQVFDYCCTLTGSDTAAAAAAAAAISCAQDLPRAPHLLRARLFAIAREEALAVAPAGHGPPPGVAVGGPGARGPAALAVLGRLPSRHREVLALVYRHGIWPEQLPAVLGVSAWEAYERLAAAEHEYVSLAAGAGRDACPALEDMVAIPVAPVPGSVWQDAVAGFTTQTSRLPALPAARPVGGRETRRRTRQRHRLQLAAAAVLPITAITWAAIAQTGGSGHTAGAFGAAGPALTRLRPVSWPSEATPETVGHQATTPTRQGTAPAIPILTLLPSTPAGTVLPVPTADVTGSSTHPAPDTAPTASASPSGSAEPSPSATSVAPSVSASPSDSASASPSASPTSATPSASPSGSSSATSPAASSSPSDTSVPASSDS